MATTETVKLVWKDPENPEPLEGVDDVLEAGKFLAWLDQSFETDGIRFYGDVQEAYPDEDAFYLEDGEPVKAASEVHVESHAPDVTETAAVNRASGYQPATDYRLETPV